MQRRADRLRRTEPALPANLQLALYRLRARLWTGPLSHLICGLLDLLEAARAIRAASR